MLELQELITKLMLLNKQKIKKTILKIIVQLKHFAKSIFNKV